MHCCCLSHSVHGQFALLQQLLQTDTDNDPTRPKASPQAAPGLVEEPSPNSHKTKLGKDGIGWMTCSSGRCVLTTIQLSTENGIWLSTCVCQSSNPKGNEDQPHSRCYGASLENSITSCLGSKLRTRFLAEAVSSPVSPSRELLHVSCWQPRHTKSRARESWTLPLLTLWGHWPESWLLSWTP
jgi:hypothetical protein